MQRGKTSYSTTKNISCIILFSSSLHVISRKFELLFWKVKRFLFYQRFFIVFFLIQQIIINFKKYIYTVTYTRPGVLKAYSRIIQRQTYFDSLILTATVSGDFLLPFVMILTHLGHFLHIYSFDLWWLMRDVVVHWQRTGLLGLRFRVRIRYLPQ